MIQHTHENCFVSRNFSRACVCVREVDRYKVFRHSLCPLPPFAGLVHALTRTFVSHSLAFQLSFDRSAKKWIPLYTSFHPRRRVFSPFLTRSLSLSLSLSHTFSLSPPIHTLFSCSRTLSTYDSFARPIRSATTTILSTLPPSLSLSASLSPPLSSHVNVWVHVCAMSASYPGQLKT